MRYSHFTPHQFESISKFYDTLVVVSYSPSPLDIAIPIDATRFIASSLGKDVQARFAGRASGLIIGGSPLGFAPTTDALQALQQTPLYDVRFGCIMMDRTLLTDVVHLSTGACEWLAFDWWCWLRNRVPARRFADALMYLCYASSDYMESNEQLRLGVQNERASAMKEEGQRLYARMVEAVSAHILNMWGPNLVDG